MSFAYKGLLGYTNRTRVDVVSEGLCDDILRLLAPSLRPYIGGTIVDYLPGAGLFSKKVHEYLKPRRHILIEPEWNHYSQYLEPLLNSPDSKYILSQRSLTKHYPLYLHWYIEDGIIPAEPESNNSTLQIVNATSPLLKHLAWQPKPIDTVIHHFSKQCRQQSHFHSRGPTRLLAWCDDHHKFGCLPRSVDQRRRPALTLETHCRVEEVMGFGSFDSDTQREQSLNDSSSQLVRQRMKEANIHIPSHRRVDDRTSEAPIPRSWHRELFNLEASLEAGEFQRYLADTKEGDNRSKIVGRKAITSTYRRMKRLRYIYNSQINAYNEAKPLADEQAKIDALYLRSYSPGLSEAETYKMRIEVEERHNALVETVKGITFNRGNQVRFISDDQHAFHMPPGPLLQWDTRSYEPLTASTSEFISQKKVALLDFQPKPYGTLPLTDDQAQYFEIISRALLGPQGHHNLRLLDAIAPAAYDALVPNIAELTDPREGGRKDASWLACRTLTPKMMWRLAIEWDKWLFKPEMEELSRSSASLGHSHVEGVKQQRFTRRQAPVSPE